MNQETVDELEKLISKVRGSYNEISLLSKKKPNDAVNGFKLKIINNIISQCNNFLEEETPIEGFSIFDEDDVPSNSDIVFVLSQYAEALEKWRSDVISQIYTSWYYVLDDETQIKTSPPQKLNRKL